jgi:hypothetical protein
MNKKIYLAARYSRHPEMREVRDWLEEQGHKVTSRWIDCHSDIVGDFTSSFTQDFLNANPDRCAPLGQHDLDDLDEADWVISFTGGGLKGGRHVELGYALARGKRLFVVGPRENVFHTLPAVEHHPDWPALQEVLQSRPSVAASEPVGPSEGPGSPHTDVRSTRPHTTWRGRRATLSGPGGCGCCCPRAVGGR